MATGGYSKHLNTLRDVSRCSSMSAKHASVIIYGGHPISHGYNSLSGGRSLHAEVAAIETFLRARGLNGFVRSRRILLASQNESFRKRTRQYSPTFK